jgi:AcrR family transcriptional regulator
VLRASPHKREEKERVRVTLLQAALELAATHGFSSLGLREVARAANIAPTSFYRHFADMSELGLALVDEHVGPLLVELATGIRAGDPRQTGAELADTILGAVEKQPELVRFMVAERVGAFAILREALRKKLDGLSNALQASMQNRSRPRARPLLAAESALALLLDGFARALDVPEKERAQLRERLAEAIGYTLEPGSESERP